MGVTLMKADLKLLFFWKGMKEDIVSYVERCIECKQVKDEHRHPARLLQPHSIPETKWEVISMDFIVGFSLMERIHDLNLLINGLYVCKGGIGHLVEG
jgi:hypothetical protein